MIILTKDLETPEPSSGSPSGVILLEQNNEQNKNDMEEERQDNSYDANNEIPLELPFP